MKLKGGQALQSFWGSVSGKIMTVTAALLALKAVWDKLNDENGFTYKAQMENVIFKLLEQWKNEQEGAGDEF